MFTPLQTELVRQCVRSRINTLSEALTTTSDVSYAWSLLIQEREELFAILKLINQEVTHA